MLKLVIDQGIKTKEKISPAVGVFANRRKMNPPLFHWLVALVGVSPTGTFPADVGVFTNIQI